MFTIIGGDGKEYGPATAEQLRAWIRAGRANLDTQAKALGTDEWRRLGDFAEFAPPDTPPPLAAPVAPPVAGAPAPAYSTPADVAAAARAELAGRGQRTGAALFNAFLYFLSTIPGSMMVARKLMEQMPELAQGKFPRPADVEAALPAVLGGIVWVYAGLFAAMILQAILIAARGRNLGKLVFGGRVVRADTGEPAGFVRGVLLRFALPVCIILALNLGTGVLGFVFLVVDYCFIFRDDQRCLHDLMAGTKVVRT
jgi:uncharacterized RDD family membrane protein YckC